MENMKNDKELKEDEKIVLSPEIQKSILKFFLRTSIPRKAREERLKKSLLEAERQETI